MPFVSVVVPTMRVGGLDILMDSLAAQTWTDLELVLVDGLYEQRRDVVLREARDRFLRVVHRGPVPNPFPNCAFCAYSNIGIKAATGVVLLFAVDYSRLPPNLVERHAVFHKLDPTGRGGMMGPHRYVMFSPHAGMPRYERDEVDRYDRDVRAGRSGEVWPYLFSSGVASDGPSPPHDADGGAVVPHDCDPKLRMPAGAIAPEYFHAKNESVRRERAVEVDGWDTDLDGAHLYQDSDFADRLTQVAGVRWLLDPSAVMEIANPRSYFPFARRSRDHRDNYRIWQEKRAAGYPMARASLERFRVRPDERVEPSGPDVNARKVRVAMIYGEFCRPGAPFDLPGLYSRQGLTGSESAFFNAAIGMSELGHQVVVFCKCEVPFDHPSGLTCMPLPALRGLREIHGLDAVIAWNEPDYLMFAPERVQKICEQQINDWAYCREPGWSTMPDLFVFPSEETMNWHRSEGGLGTTYPVRPEARFAHVPNSCNPEHFVGEAERNPHRAVWASSPDRGLHHLLSMWPAVRARVPSAELRIFYEVRSLLERVRFSEEESGRRARYIEAALPRLANHGVSVMGFVDNLTMAREYRAAAALPYTFDPERHTETFGCAVLDACAGGCRPIVSDLDCLPSVHGAASTVIGNPSENRQRWVDEICRHLTEEAESDEVAAMADHAAAHARPKVAAAWARLIAEASR